MSSRLQPATYLHSIVSQKWLELAEVPVWHFWSLFIVEHISITSPLLVFTTTPWKLKMSITTVIVTKLWRNVHRNIFRVSFLMYASHRWWKRVASFFFFCLKVDYHIVIQSNLQYRSWPAVEICTVAHFEALLSHLLLSAVQSPCSSVIILWGALQTYLWLWFPEIVEPSEALP